MQPPDLAIDGDIDIVVAPDRCAVLTLGAFTTLFGDVGIAFQQVPANVASMTEAFQNSFPLTDDSVRALQGRCGRRMTDAKRLHHIVSRRRDALEGLSKKDMKTLLKTRGLESSLVGDELSLDKDTVSDFLDLVEGRLFSDDVTGEERRADAYSPRTP